MNKYIILAISLAVLGGCVSAEEMEMRKKQHCANMGAPQGSKDYYQCRKDLEDRIFLENELQKERFRAASAMYPYMVGQQQQPTMRQPVNCQSYRMGGSIHTNCM